MSEILNNLKSELLKLEGRISNFNEYRENHYGRNTHYRMLLEDQRNYMDGYLVCLEMRIDAIENRGALN